LAHLPLACLEYSLGNSITGINLEIEKNLALRECKGNYEARLSLSTRTKEELTWWIGNVGKAFNPISHGISVIEIRTDASKRGWGAYLDGDTTQGM